MSLWHTQELLEKGQSVKDCLDQADLGRWLQRIIFFALIDVRRPRYWEWLYKKNDHKPVLYWFLSLVRCAYYLTSCLSSLTDFPTIRDYNWNCSVGQNKTFLLEVDSVKVFYSSNISRQALKPKAKFSI